MRPLDWHRALTVPCCTDHDPAPNHSTMAVAGALLRYASVANCTVRITNAQLQALARCSESTVRRALQALTAAGWLLEIRTMGKPTIYVLTVPQAVDNCRTAARGGCHSDRGRGVTVTPPYARGGVTVTPAVGTGFKKGHPPPVQAVDNVAAVVADLADRHAL